MFSQLFQYIARIRQGISLPGSNLQQVLKQICELEAAYQHFSDSQLRHRTATLDFNAASLRLRRQSRVEAFAIIREAAARTTGLRPYDVQIEAALALSDGCCVEMKTGEGKTLVAALAACFHVLSSTAAHRRHVHVLTFNDYLAERDADWMQPLYRFLNLTSGHVVQATPTTERRAAYHCDITYITAREAGFDFLRDQLCYAPQDQVQRGFDIAIFDEADSLLIDEARIPLVIAAEDEKDDTNLYALAEIVADLTDNLHYEIKSGGRNVSFTEEGLTHLEHTLGISELHSAAHADFLARLNLALQAHCLLKKNRDYLVRDGRIELIDEFTGRVAENRKWPGGLQAALEAKERLSIQPQGRILNAVTLQQFAGQYKLLSGMTGTAIEAAEELSEVYRMPTVVIRPHRPCRRMDLPDRIFRTRQEKYDALAAEILSRHRRGQPVLVGTASVEESVRIAMQLREAGMTCRILNAANDYQEAEVIADAGAIGAITISTNMAGRGTDIVPGGRDGRSRGDVLDCGGLFVVGTNRHESRRIDNQLRGRAGRQGDPGESQFFVSCEDPLLVRHNIAALITEKEAPADGELNDDRTARMIEHVQRIIEGESFEIRTSLRVYSHLMDVQRRAINEDRIALLTNKRPPMALQKHAPELREQLTRLWGEETVQEAERLVTLIHIDWCWSDHLERAAEIRNSIHLVRFGGLNPHDEFNRLMRMEFESFLTEVEHKVVATLESAQWTSDGIDIKDAGLQMPSSTWTFMVNDNPGGMILNQLIRGVMRRVSEALG